MLTENLTIQIPVFFYQEDEMIIVQTPALSLATQGENQEDAMRNFDEMVKLWLETAIERRSLKDALIELGWKVSEGNVEPACKAIPFERTYPISIPRSAISQGKDQELRTY